MCIFIENWSNRYQLQAIWKLFTFQSIVKYFVINAAKDSLLPLKSFTGRSPSCIAFELLRIPISFVTSVTATELKINLSQFSWIAEISSAFGWFLHFTITFRVGWSMLFDNGASFSHSSKFRLVTTLENKSFRVFATFYLSVIRLSSSVRVIVIAFLVSSPQKFSFQNVSSWHQWNNFLFWKLLAGFLVHNHEQVLF